jgi:riboflavin synthase
MFTGLVEDTGRVLRIAPQGAGRRLWVRSQLDLTDTRLGDSIAVNGVCLTVVELRGAAGAHDVAFDVAFDIGPESLAVTTLGALGPDHKVHLERAVRLADRLGGHLVAGHVDGIGRVATRRPDGDTLFVRVEAPKPVLDLCIHKGSIAIDGVSLTLNAVDDTGFEVWLIPHTLKGTHLGQLQPGSRVNLESDLIGKYVQKLLRGGGGGGGGDGVSWELLRKAGFGG